MWIVATSAGAEPELIFPDKIHGQLLFWEGKINMRVRGVAIGELETALAVAWQKTARWILSGFHEIAARPTVEW